MSKNTTESDPSEYFTESSVNQPSNQNVVEEEPPMEVPPVEAPSVLEDALSDNKREQFLRYGVTEGPRVNGEDTRLVADFIYVKLVEKSNILEVDHQMDVSLIMKLKRRLEESEREKEYLREEIKRMKSDQNDNEPKEPGVDT